MPSNRAQIIRTQFLEYGQQLDKLPENDPEIVLTELGNGGAMLSEGATRTLVSLMRGDDDLVIIDRFWLQRHLERLGLQGGDINLLIDAMTGPINHNTPGLTIHRFAG